MLLRRRCSLRIYKFTKMSKSKGVYFHKIKKISLKLGEVKLTKWTSLFLATQPQAYKKRWWGVKVCMKNQNQRWYLLEGWTGAKCRTAGGQLGFIKKLFFSQHEVCGKIVDKYCEIHRADNWRSRNAHLKTIRCVRTKIGAKKFTLHNTIRISSFLIMKICDSEF